MGIYQSRAKNPINEFTIQPTVTRGGPSTFANRMHEIKGPEKDWTGLRRAKPVNTMLPKSVAWADSLPPAVRPNALIAEFPRIVNLLALQWNSTGPLRAYFDDLLTDHRGTRRGFPEAVYNEISALRDYHYSLSPNLALE